MRGWRGRGTLSETKGRNNRRKGLAGMGRGGPTRKKEEGCLSRKKLLGEIQARGDHADLCQVRAGGVD